MSAPLWMPGVPRVEPTGQSPIPLGLQGKGLAIDGLDKEKGSLRVSGQIDRLAYIEAKKKKGFSLLEALRK